MKYKKGQVTNHDDKNNINKTGKWSNNINFTCSDACLEERGFVFQHFFRV